MEKRVGIFGGSFDPVHNGHIRIVQSFLKSGLVDEILVLLTPDPPHKKQENQAPFSHRMEMLKRAFAGQKQVQVSDLETKLPAPSYTLQTIEYLQEKFPETTWFLCMGEDSLATFKDWHRYDEILNKLTLLVAERPGIEISNVSPEILEKTAFVKHEPVNISSSGIRGEGNADSSPSIPEPVADYIRQHRLYKNRDIL